MHVHLQKNQHKNTPSKKQFVEWVKKTVNSLPDKSDKPNKLTPHISEITIRIVDQNESQHLNETFRHKKGPTNVLSFSYENIPGFESDSLGDLAICAEIVAKEAESLKINVNDHWAHLTVHGTLHLLGYDHMTDSDAEIMEALEIEILKQFGIGNPYLEHEGDTIND